MVRAMLAVAAAVMALTAYLALPQRKGDPGRLREVRLAISRSESSFSIAGSTAAEIRKSLWYYGPAGHWGATRYRVAWPADFIQAGNGCRIENPRVEASLRIRTPVLSWRSRAPECLSRAFEAMRRALVAHEDEHAAIAIRGFEAMARRLGEVDQAAGCDTARAEWERIARREMAALESRQAAFDRQTRHGSDRGVALEECPSQ